MAAVDDQLDLERRRAPLATIGACVAAVLPMAGGIAVARTIRDQPKNTPGRLLYIHDHSGKFVLYSILLGLGALALVFPLRYLYDATKARKPQLPRVALICALLGPVIYGIVQVGLQAILVSKASTFADPAHGNQTYEEAKNVFESGEVRLFQFLGLGAQLALGFAFVMICLNAMRVGLLTRFMGVLGNHRRRPVRRPAGARPAGRAVVLARRARRALRGALAQRHPARLDHRPRRPLAQPAGAARAARVGPGARARGRRRSARPPPAPRRAARRHRASASARSAGRPPYNSGFGCVSVGETSV